MTDATLYQMFSFTECRSMSDDSCYIKCFYSQNAGVRVMTDATLYQMFSFTECRSTSDDRCYIISRTQL